jgi:hypothetical protein
MHDRAPSRIPLRFIFAVFFFALTMAAVARPLVRAKFNFAPELVSIHQGITGHTYLEVGASTPEVPPVLCSLAAGNLREIVQLDHRIPDLASDDHPDNWPILLARIYRRIPPDGDSDPIA